MVGTPASTVELHSIHTFLEAPYRFFDVLLLWPKKIAVPNILISGMVQIYIHIDVPSVISKEVHESQYAKSYT